MSQKHKLKDAFRYLKMDGNVAAAARRSGLSEHMLRRRVDQDDEWHAAQVEGRKRKEVEETRARLRDLERYREAARGHRLVCDRFRRQFYESIPAMSRGKIAAHYEKLAALETAALEAERLYFRARHEQEKRCPSPSSTPND